MVRPVIFVTAALLCGGTPALGSEIGLIRGLVADLDRNSGVSASAGGIIAGDRGVTVSDLVVKSTDSSGPALRFDELTFTEPVTGQDGGFRFAAMTARGLAYSAGGLGVEIPELSLTSAEIAAGDLASLPVNLGSLVSLLSEVEFQNLEIPTVRYTNRHRVDKSAESANVTDRIDYTDLTVSGMAGGVAAQMGAGPISIALAGRPEGQITASLDSVAAWDVDLAAYAHIFNFAAESGANADWQQIIPSAEYRGIELQLADATRAEVDSVVLNGYRLRAGEKSLRDRYRDTGMMADMSSLSPPDPAQLGAVLALLRSFRVDRIAISGLTVHPQANKDQSLSIDRIGLTDASFEGIGSVLVHAIGAQTPDVLFWLDRLELKNIGFPGASELKDLIALGDMNGASRDTPPSREEARLALSVLPSIDQYALSGMRVSVGSFKPVTLASANASVAARLHSMPVEGTIAIDSLVIPTQNLANGTDPGAQLLEMMGYESFIVDLEGRSTFDRTDGRVSASGSLQIADVADLHATYEVSGFADDRLDSPAAISPGGPGAPGDGDELASVPQALDTLTLDSLAFRLQDRSFVGRAVAAAAAQTKTDPDLYREQIQAAVPFFLVPLRHPALQTLAANAVTRFLEGGQELEIKINPKAPVPVSPLIEILESAPGEAIELLDPTLETRPIGN